MHAVLEGHAFLHAVIASSSVLKVVGVMVYGAPVDMFLHEYTFPTSFLAEVTLFPVLEAFAHVHPQPLAAFTGHGVHWGLLPSPHWL